MNFKMASQNTFSLLSFRTTLTTTQFPDSKTIPRNISVHDIFVQYFVDISNTFWYVPEIIVSVISVGINGNAAHK